MRTRYHAITLLALAATVAAQRPDGADVRPTATDPRVMLDYAAFDPTVSVPSVPNRLAADADINLHIVQFHSTPTDADRDAVRRAGGEAVAVEVPFGSALDPEEVVRAIHAGPTRMCVVVHAETSTGVLTDLRPIARGARDARALFCVDCVTSIAGVPLEFDDVGVDAAFCGKQKCLSVPPGLAPVTFSERALERVRARTHPVPFYFDTSLLTGYFGAERSYHYTAPVSMVYALDAALDEIEQEGLDARFQRHRDVSAAFRRGLGPLGLEPLVPAAHAAPMLTPVCYPDGVDDAAFRRHLRQQHHIEVGGGLGDLAGRVFRVGLMGHGARTENVVTALRALGDGLRAQGHAPDVEAAVAAVHGG